MGRTITVIGLGAGDEEQLTVGVRRILESGKPLYLRTASHPAAVDLQNKGFVFRSFDNIYEQYEDFSTVYETIVQKLLALAEKESIVYAVPGHPFVAEKTVELLLARAETRGISVEIKGGQSFIDPLLSALQIDPIEGLQILDATRFHRDEICLNQHLIFCQVYDVFTASRVKLELMEKLPDDYEIRIVQNVGSRDEHVQVLPLYELDRRFREVHNLTTVYVPPVQKETLLYREFTKLRNVIAALRGPDGCPWDQKQTHQSLKKYLIEEAYEVWDAIDAADEDGLAEELGDVLLQVMLHAQIAEDEGYFTIDDVIGQLTAKMIRRHPHVFGDQIAKSAEDVRKRWEEIKKEERGEGETTWRLDEVPRHLPAVYRALSYQERAADVGFDFPTKAEAWEKTMEELEELKKVCEQENFDEIRGELGDVLFALINIARFYNIDPEDSLNQTCRKFKERFSYIEQKLSENGKTPDEANLEEMERYWQEAKQKKLKSGQENRFK